MAAASVVTSVTPERFTETLTLLESENPAPRNFQLRVTRRRLIVGSVGHNLRHGVSAPGADIGTARDHLHALQSEAPGVDGSTS